MNMAEFNPFVRYIDKRDNFYTGKTESIAYDYRLFYIIKGSTRLIVEGETHALKQNDMAIIPPGIRYRSEYEGEIKVYVINMDICFENPVEGPLIPSPYHLFKKEKMLSKTLWNMFPKYLSCEGNAEEILEKIFNLSVGKPEYYFEHIAALLKALILDAMAYTAKDSNPKLIQDIKRYLDENCSENITNKVIGDEFSYHPNYVNRMFKKYTGETVHSYVTKARLKKSLHMILESDYQVAEISNICGFSSYAYFIKCFREKYGVSPLKYRKQRNKA
ncbi:MAG: helix-turn-helix domain-containing protein [Clostridia bacterium]|nr:helix-turn-helix domain-containing protein [Clostridia bacterium]